MAREQADIDNREPLSGPKDSLNNSGRATTYFADEARLRFRSV